MAELKTKPTSASVDAFLDAVEPEGRRNDARAVCALLQKITGERPRMWGAGIVGFGEQRLVYASGRELDWMVVGFSPRKAATTLYLGNLDESAALLAKLGKHKLGTGCLYVDKLSDVDAKVLEQLVRASVRRAQAASEG